MWRNPSEALPSHGFKVLVIGVYPLINEESKEITSTPNIYCEGYWDENQKKWFVDNPDLMKQILHGYARVEHWTHLP